MAARVAWRTTMGLTGDVDEITTKLIPEGGSHTGTQVFLSRSLVVVAQRSADEDGQGTDCVWVRGGVPRSPQCVCVCVCVCESKSLSDYPCVIQRVCVCVSDICIRVCVCVCVCSCMCK